MKKILALMLALVMLLSFAACGKANKTDDKADKATEANKEDPTTAPTEPSNDPTEPEANVKPISSLIISMNSNSMTISDNGDGTAYVELMSDEAYAYGPVDASCLDIIAQALATTNYEALEVPAEEDWAGYAALQVSFGEDDFFSYEAWHSEISDDFMAVFTTLLTAFEQIAEQLPEPEMVVEGEIAEGDRAAIDGILGNLELWGSPDMFSIMGISTEDESFGWFVGLPSAEGVESGLRFGPMNSSVPYRLSIVTASGSAEDLAKAFEENIDWQVFGCVFPDHALIATKDNQALLLLGADDEFAQPYTLTANAIEAAGWTIYNVLDNPDL